MNSQFNISSLNAALRQCRYVRGPVTFKLVTTSTNDDVRQLAADGAAEGAVVVAAEQTAGRGRLGRRWSGQPGQTLMFSVLLRPALPLEKWPALAVVAGLAATRACAEASGAAIGTKWPNDIVFGGRKLGGLLLEARAPHFAVLGIGVNVHGRPTDLPPELQETATTLAAITSAPLSSEKLLLSILQHLDQRYHLLLTGQQEALLTEQRERETLLGQQVLVTIGGETVTGQATDVTAAGELVLQTAAGRRVVSSGEVQRVRPEIGEAAS